MDNVGNIRTVLEIFGQLFVSEIFAYNVSANNLKYRGVGNIRTGNIRTTLEIFGQCWKYSDNSLSLKLSLEIIGQTFFAEKFLCRLYFQAFSTFDYFHSCQKPFDSLYFDYLSIFSTSEPSI